MIENVSTQLTVFHCFARCLLPGRAFASLYVLLFLEKEAEIGGRAWGHGLYRGSYMSAHVLLNLLNELGKRDKMRGLPSILSLFRNEFYKFNNILRDFRNAPFYIHRLFHMIDLRMFSLSFFILL